MAVSKRALRRMAYQSDRRPEMTLILHDALLETYPREYSEAISESERISGWAGDPYYVVFLPSRLGSQRPLFKIYTGWSGAYDSIKGPRALARVIRPTGHADPRAVATYSTSRRYPIGGRE